MPDPARCPQYILAGLTTLIDTLHTSNMHRKYRHSAPYTMQNKVLRVQHRNVIPYRICTRELIRYVRERRGQYGITQVLAAEVHYRNALVYEYFLILSSKRLELLKKQLDRLLHLPNFVI